jgi:NhaA family Na+:H+ antiporter
MGSGVHATLAGVVLGVLTPLRPNYSEHEFAAQLQELQHRYHQAVKSGDDEASALALGRLEELVIGTEPPLERAERLLHPWVTAFVLPLFALANAGVTLSSDAIRGSFQNTVTLGVTAGLLVGKFIGITLSCWIAAKLKVAQLPGRVSWGQVAGMAAAAGIGFTVSLFIAGLSFSDDSTVQNAKVGILLASGLSAVAGYALLVRFANTQIERRASARN